MKKLLWILIVAAGMSLPTASWAASRHAVVVQMNDNSKVSFRLADDPQLTFDGTRVVMKTKSQQLEYLCQNISKVYLADDVSAGINNPVSGDDLAITISHGMLSADGLSPGQSTTVYSLDGRLLGKAKASQSGSLQMDLNQYGSKIVIIRVGNRAIKITI